MSLPSLASLPTDNLYKFGAFVGLIMAVVAFFGWPYVHKQLADEEARRWHETTAKRDSFYVQTTDLLIRAEEIKDKGRKDKIVSQLEEDRRNIWSNDNSRWQYEVNQRNQYLLLFLVIALMFSIAGPLMLFLGLIFWWFKVQCYQDQVIAAEAAKANKESADAAQIMQAAVEKVAAEFRAAIRPSPA